MAEVKLKTAEEAVKELVKNGATVYLGGVGQCYPYAVAHEMIRQRKKDLTLTKGVGDTLFGHLIGAGCVKKVITSYVVNVTSEGIRIENAFKRAIEEGIPNPIGIEDYSFMSLSLMYLAGAMGFPFIPAKGMLGSDMVKFSKLRISIDPFKGEKVALLPALNPDVGIAHVQRCDKYGNAQTWGTIGDRWALRASAKVIISAEEIVDSRVVRSDPNRTLMPAHRVDAVVHEPWGAHPSIVTGYYNADRNFYTMYAKLSETAEGMKNFLDEWVYGVKNRKEYIGKLGGERLRKLKVKKHLYSEPVDYGY